MSNFNHTSSIIGSKATLNEFVNEKGNISYSFGYGNTVKTSWKVQDSNSAAFEKFGFGSSSKGGDFDPKTYMCFVNCPSAILEGYQAATDKEKFLQETADKMMSLGFRVLPVTGSAPIATKSIRQSIESGLATLDKVADSQLVPNSEIYMKVFLLAPGQKVSDKLTEEFGRKIVSTDVSTQDNFKWQILATDLTFEEVIEHETVSENADALEAAFGDF